MSIDDLTAPRELGEMRRRIGILVTALRNFENDDGRVPAPIWDERNRALALVSKREGDWTCPECGGDADIFTPDNCCCHQRPPCSACETNPYIRCDHCGHEFEGGWM